jgi:hypothetical protein
MDNKNSAFQLVVVALLALLVGVVSTVVIFKSFDKPKFARVEKEQMIEQIADEAVEEKEEKELSEETEIACAANWDLFEGDNFSFCHDQKWGAPNLTENSTVKGKLYSINFENSRVRENEVTHTSPSIWWETKDLVLSDGDYELTCFDCMDFTKSESDLIKELGYEDKNAALEKTMIDGKNALRLTADYTVSLGETYRVNKVQYFIPNAFESNHFQVSVSAEMAQDLDEMMKTLVFKN